MKLRCKYHGHKVWTKGQLIVWCPIGAAVLQIAGIEAKVFSSPADAILYGNTVEVLG